VILITPSSSSSSSSDESASGSETESRESENSWKDVRISVSFWARGGAWDVDVEVVRREDERVGGVGAVDLDVLARVRFVVVVVAGAGARLRFGG
jgi:hypothetical protein